MQLVQGTLDELSPDLSQVTFVVVDLETTGGSPRNCQITEVGAVKVRAGEAIAEFQTLVDPGEPIPAFISVLTGITDAMVAGAPRLDSVLPAFLEFARDAVLVAHNAPFDISFLRAGADRLGLTWPGNRVIDTARLARQLVTRDEAPNCKLSSLARVFAAETVPDHRALHDARATVDVLHGLIARVGNLGVTTLDELATFTSRVSVAQRRKRRLAEHLPHAPGVYLFQDRAGRVLYVGSSHDLRARVRSYFTASEQRTRMAEMVGVADHVSYVECLTPLEARVRELRLIAEHEPRYNRRSRRPAGRPWVKLTVEPFPRLSIVRTVLPDGATYVGPFPSRDAARAALDALHEAVPLRQCSARLAAKPAGSACALAELGRCVAPCDGRLTREEYAAVADGAMAMLAGDCRMVLTTLRERMSSLSEQRRYEDAASVRDRMLALVRGAARAQRLAPVAAIPELVAARRRAVGGWEVISVRHGRLAGTTLTPAGADPTPFIDALRASAEMVAAPCPPQPAASWEETDLVLGWLDSPGVRLVRVDGEWTCPVNGAGGAHAPLERARRDQAEMFDGRRSPRTRHQPAGAVASAS
jgi:DNA polymerase-3 subunit epsilon